MLGCRQKMIMASFNAEGTTTKAELDGRSKQISLATKGEDTWGHSLAYGQYDRMWWKIDNTFIMKRLIEKGLVVRVSRGVYQKN